MAVKTTRNLKTKDEKLEQNNNGLGNSDIFCPDTHLKNESQFSNDMKDINTISYDHSGDSTTRQSSQDFERNARFLAEDESLLDTEEKRFLFLKDVRLALKRNGGRLMFKNPLFLVDVLSQCFSDRLPTTRSLGMDVLSESIPFYEFDLDQHMGLLFPQLLQNLLHDNPVIKKSAMQVLHLYFKHTKNKSIGLNTLIKQGITSDNPKLQKEVLMSMPHLIPLGFSKNDLEYLFTVILMEIKKIEHTSSSFPMVIVLEHTKDCMDKLVFKRFISELDSDLRSVYEHTMETSSLVKIKNGELNSSTPRSSKKDSPRHSEVLKNGNHTTPKTTQKTPRQNGIHFQTDSFVYGFIPDEIIIKLKKENGWQIRSEAINELNEVILLCRDDDCLRMHARDLLGYLSELSEDTNLNVQLTTLNILHKVILKIGTQVQNHLDIVLNALVRKLSDPKIVVRKILLRIALSLMHGMKPMSFIQAVIPFLKHKNTRTREEIINMVTAALLSFPSTDFDLVTLPKHLAPTLIDPKRRVRHASMECFAILAQQLGSGRLSPLVSAVNEIESLGGGDGILKAVQTRLGRRILPHINENGLVGFALQVPANTSRGDKFAADVAWVIAGATGIGSANPDSSRQGNESARYLSSAGKKKLPWQNPEFQDLQSPRKLVGSAPAKANQIDGVMLASSETKHTPVNHEAWVADGSSPTNKIDSNLEKFMARTNSCNENDNPYNRSESQGSYFEMYKTRMKKLKAAGLQADSAMINSVKPYAVLPQAYKQNSNDKLRLESVRSPIDALSPISPTEDLPRPCIMSPTETEKNMGMPFKPTLARSASKTKQKMRMQARRESDVDKEYQEESVLAHTLPKAKTERRISLDGLASPFPSRPTIHRTPSGRITNRPQQLEKMDKNSSNLKNMKKLSNSSPSLTRHSNPVRKSFETSSSPDYNRNPSPIIRSPHGKRLSPVSPISSPRRSPQHEPIPVQTKAESTFSLDSSSDERTEPDHPGTPKLAKSAQEKLRKHKELRQSTDSLIIVKRKKENRLSRSVDSVDALKKRSSFHENDFNFDLDKDLKHLQSKEQQLRMTNERQTSFNQEKERNTFESEITKDVPKENKVLNYDEIPVGNFKKRKKRRSAARADPSQENPLVRHATKHDTDPFGKLDFDTTPEKVQGIWENKDIEQNYKKSSPRSSHSNVVHSPRSDQPNNINYPLNGHQSNDSPRSLSEEYGDSLEITGSSVLHQNGPSMRSHERNTPKKNENMTLDFNNNEESPQDLVIKGKKTKKSPRGIQPKIASSPQVSRRTIASQPPVEPDHSVSPHKTHSFTDDLERECEQPQNAVTDALELLATGPEEWESKCEGLITLRRVCRYHSAYLTDLHTIVTAVLKEVKNLRSQVTRLAINAIAELFAAVPKAIEMELEIILKTVLPKAGDTNKFIRADVTTALTSLVQNIQPSKAMAGIITTGVSNKNDSVRSLCAKSLADIADTVTPSRVLTTHKDIVMVVGKLAVDRNEETRYNARRILFLLRDHPELDRLLEKNLASVNVRPVRDIVENLRAKGHLEPPSSGSATLRTSMRSSTLPSPGMARRSRNLRSGSPSSKAQHNDTMPSQEGSRQSGQRRRPPNGVRQDNPKNTPLDMSLLDNLGSNQWSERLQAIDDFYDLVSMNPSLVGTHSNKIFDKFCPRLNDSNSKVNLHALDTLNRIVPILRDHMIPTITIVIDNLKKPLASNNDAMYQAARQCLATITKNIDNVSLVQPLVSQVQMGNVRNKPEFVERLADIIQPVFARKSGLITRQVMPLLWNLLSTQTSGAVTPGRASIHSAVSRLSHLLYECIGEELLEEARLKGARASQKLEAILEL